MEKKYSNRVLDLYCSRVVYEFVYIYSYEYTKDDIPIMY